MVEKKSDKILVIMTQGGNFGLGGIKTNEDGTALFDDAGELSFTPDHPFQLATKSQAEHLVANYPERFKLATSEELEQFYGVENS